jgi:poly-gamma-glutamate capsule biosynthesis protein CapA/YwtB (metallophosphatase superfamily)
MISAPATLRTFLCGDVMTGRGIDQILPHPCNPRLYERGVRSALDYVYLAEEATGEIHKPVANSYIWGVVLEELERKRPHAKVINLETSVTRSEDFIAKGINYRMSPENASCLLAAGVDCCALANNHVLDWGEVGLLETLITLEKLGIKTAGAGRNQEEAWSPAILDVAGMGRVLVFACASVTSGVPLGWVAKHAKPGIALLPDFSEECVTMVANEVARARRPNDVVILSVHWGPNWGFHVPQEQRRFAREVIDRADISVLHGHSSHHVKGIEVYRNRLILYGCGDFLNDYEGISGYEEFRGDLAIMYFADIDPASRNLVGLEMVPLQIRHFQLHRPAKADIEWIHNTLDSKSRPFGGEVEATPNGRLALAWPERPLS